MGTNMLMDTHTKTCRFLVTVDVFFLSAPVVCSDTRKPSPPSGYMKNRPEEKYTSSRD